ncbi:MAG: MFS transporter [Phycisphaerales bacterium JB065]
MKLTTLNPFRGLDEPVRVWAWGMFDLANQSFTLLINTLLFALFFKRVVVTDPDRGDFLWSLTVAISLFVVVLAGPVLGVLADYKAWKKEFLVWFGLACVALTCGLALVPSGASSSNALLIAMLIYIPANISYNIGENFLASFLPEVANRKNMGRVSATGWTMGYVGALLLLAITALLMKFVISDGTENWRPLFVFAGLWFAVMALPTVLLLHEKARPRTLPAGETVVSVTVKQLQATVTHALAFRDLTVFLCAFFIYGFGVQAIIFFAGVIASDDFGFGDARLVIFMLVSTICAGCGAIGTAMFQDRLGHKKTVWTWLGAWTAVAVSLAVLSYGRSTNPDFPVWPLWIVTGLLGASLGGIGASTRATVGYFTPAHRTGEFFNLWGLTYKLAGAIGVLIFGIVRSTMGSVPSLVTLGLFFVVGAVILIFVNETRGGRIADEAEAAFDPDRPADPEVPVMEAGLG